MDVMEKAAFYMDVLTQIDDKRFVVWLIALLFTLSCGPLDLAREVLLPSETIFVELDGDDTNDCRSEETACRTVSVGIDKAANDAAIQVGAGTFILQGKLLDESVRIVGDGENQTILDGAGVGPLFHIGTEDESGAGIALWLESLTLENGRNGVVWNYGGDLWMSNVAVGDSWLGVWDGIYNVEGGSMTLTDVSFEGIRFEESDTASCAAITNEGQATLTGVTFRDIGGARAVICNRMDADMQLFDSRLEDNDSQAINNSESARLRAHQLVVRNNRRDRRTAGIFNRGVAIVTGSLIEGNQITALEGAAGAGGIHNFGELQIAMTAVVNNVGTNGGGIYNEAGGSISLRNVTISGNEATKGLWGGIFSYGSSSLDHVTIAANQGFGLARSVDGETPNMKNSIIANNSLGQCTFALSPSGPGDAVVEEMVVSGGNNIASDDDCLLFETGDMEDTDPELLPLAEGGYHPLPPSSPAVDAFSGDCAESDQRGVRRPQYEGCDIGAYEYDGETHPFSLPLEESPPLSTVTPTKPEPQAPMVGVDTLCWRGPGSSYEVVSALEAGTEVQILGRGIEGDWWVIDNPRYQGVRCWAPGEDIEVQPNYDFPDTLFEIPPLPTPTATPIQGCLYQGPNENEATCYPINQCPVDFDDSQGACIP